MTELMTGEWLLTKAKLTNGAGVILSRSLWCSGLIYFVMLSFRNIIDPARTDEFSFLELRLQMLETGGWFAGIVAGTYTAFYARFSSQWSYLAGLYNQIKATECRDSHTVKENECLAEWKAGFIEDAEILHLAKKPLFATVIKSWAEDEAVKEQYKDHVPGGYERLNRILQDVIKVYDHSKIKYSPRKSGS